LVRPRQKVFLVCALEGAEGTTPSYFLFFLLGLRKVILGLIFVKTFILHHLMFCVFFEEKVLKVKKLCDYIVKIIKITKYIFVNKLLYIPHYFCGF